MSMKAIFTHFEALRAFEIISLCHLMGDPIRCILTSWIQEAVIHSKGHEQGLCVSNTSIKRTRLCAQGSTSNMVVEDFPAMQSRTCNSCPIETARFVHLQKQQKRKWKFENDQTIYPS